MQKKQKITAVKARLKLILPPTTSCPSVRFADGSLSILIPLKLLPSLRSSFGRQTVICLITLTFIVRGLRSGINCLTPFFQGGHYSK
jgi:hypothetical protein